MAMAVQMQRNNCFRNLKCLQGFNDVCEELCVLDGLRQQVIPSCGSDWREARNIKNYNEKMAIGWP